MAEPLTALDEYLSASRSLKAEERRAAKAKHDGGQDQFDNLKRLLDSSNLPKCVDLDITAPNFPEDPLVPGSYGTFRFIIHGSTPMYMHVHALDEIYEVSVGWMTSGGRSDKLCFDDVLKKLAEFITDNEPPQS